MAFPTWARGFSFVELDENGVALWGYDFETQAHGWILLCQLLQGHAEFLECVLGEIADFIVPRTRCLE